MKKMKEVTTAHVAKMLGKGEQTIRIMTQQGAPFGTAVRSQNDSRNFNYIFYPNKLIELVGVERYMQTMYPEDSEEMIKEYFERRAK